MLLDLGRNDVGRVSVAGSVKARAQGFWVSGFRVETARVSSGADLRPAAVAAEAPACPQRE